MAAPFWKADPRVWPVAMAPWVDGSTPWPAELVAEDLRWWADQVAVKRETLPGRPTLARRWSWTDWAVKKALQEHDPLRRQRSASAPPADRQPTASAPPAEERANADEQAHSASRPPADRQRSASAPPADRHARGVDRADRATEQTDVHEPPADPPPAIREPVLVSPVERPPVADDWTQLAEHYASMPWGPRRPKGCDKPGAGVQLSTLLDVCEDLQTAKTVLDWWAWADTPRARHLRTGDAKGSESDAAPVYGLPTLTTKKNAHEYITQALSWAKQRNPPRRKLSADAPSPRSLSIPEQRARDVISDGPTPIQRKLAEQAAKRAKEKP